MSEDPKQPNPSSDQFPAPATPARRSAPARRRTPWVVAILLLLGLIALALFSGYQWLQRQSLEQQVSNLSQRVSDIGQQRQTVATQVTDRLRSLEAARESQASQLQELTRRVDQAANALLQRGNRTRGDWLLAEAEYLLRIANQRLRMESDISGALALLESADDVLRESEDLGVYPVRQALAEEIMALRAVEEVDRVGIYLQLEAAIDQVERLTAANLAASTPLDTAAPSSSVDGEQQQSANSWQQAWQSVKQTLDEVISIRRLDEPVKPLLSPRQSAYANLNLRLMLEEAEMALLRGDEVLYRRALGKASEWLQSWYDSSNPQVEVLLGTLERLAQLEIQPELPDISESLNLLKARINGRLATDQSPPDNTERGEPES